MSHKLLLSLNFKQNSSTAIFEIMLIKFILETENKTTIQVRYILLFRKWNYALNFVNGEFL